jgi:hypothetical protein
VADVIKIMLPNPKNPRAMVNYTFTLAESLLATGDGLSGNLAIYRYIPYGGEPKAGYTPIPGVNYTHEDALKGTIKTPVLGKEIKLVGKPNIGQTVTDGKNLYYVPHKGQGVYIMRNYFK